jgi:uncharacterized protein YndB with AHSA1/START domain
MTVVTTVHDRDALTLTVVAELAAPPSRVWQVWSDPRLLERWWGPPTFPATFETYEFVSGGTATYCMTGPDGEQPRGWWRFIAIDEPTSLEFEDGFADDSGTPNANLPVTTARVELEAIPAGTRMTVTSHFASLEQLEELITMGVVEGMTAAMNQIDGVLASV